MDSPQRTQILEAVWAVVARQGLEAVSVRSVAAAAQVSPGRVQHYFRSRSELVLASAQELIDRAASRHEAALGDPGSPRTLETLLLHAVVPGTAANPGVALSFSYIAAAVGDPRIGDVLASAQRGRIEAVAACLATQAPRVTDPARTARELVLLAEGATQAVFLGWATAAQARTSILAAIARTTAPGG
ncbi:TetR/AcrR family transcriptional regulator [Brachybacterium hainanense]|uniref:TetR/AcrR family transcriptional regulator n=1 Tax=Brachybacterium hainanense TaxID=1541174 RepID=A0ABV6R784_9MICO